MAKGTLYVVPSVIAPDTQQLVIPDQVRHILPGITHFLAEDIRTARRYLSSLKIYESIEPLHFAVLNKDTEPQAMAELFAPIMSGHPIGVLSESGCPGVADPGAMAVAYAHQHDIRVIPLTGPSSILLALMASGLNGQQFAFHGYLPIDGSDITKAIRELEKESQKKNQTQIVIETPYRNQSVFNQLIKTLTSETQLCIAIDITSTSEHIQTKRVSQWRKTPIELPKAPAVFLFLSK